jgi:hypothetical protein
MEAFEKLGWRRGCGMQLAVTIGVDDAIVPQSWMSELNCGG